MRSIVEEKWQQILDGEITEINEIVSCMERLNIRDDSQNVLNEERRKKEFNKYLMQRNKWSKPITGKNLKDLYYQHFPQEEGEIYV